jgi:hypothetical protein
MGLFRSDHNSPFLTSHFRISDVIFRVCEHAPKRPDKKEEKGKEEKGKEENEELRITQRKKTKLSKVEPSESP